MKREWLKQLRNALKDRNLTASGTDSYGRSSNGVQDGLLLPLRAWGRGETGVSLEFPAVSVTVAAVEELAAELRGGPLNQDKVTHGMTLLALLELSSANNPSATTDLNVDALEDLPQVTDLVMKMVDDVAAPWWQSCQDLEALLAQMREREKGRQFLSMETLIALALLQGDLDTARGTLSAYDCELDRRGADLPAFAVNRRFRDAARARLQSH